MCVPPITLKVLKFLSPDITRLFHFKLKYLEISELSFFRVYNFNEIHVFCVEWHTGGSHNRLLGFQLKLDEQVTQVVRIIMISILLLTASPTVRVTKGGSVLPLYKISVLLKQEAHMERHSCLIWPKRRLYIQNIVSLCQFIITLYGLVISLCGFIIVLCQIVILLCGFIFILCHLAFRYVGLSLCYVEFSFRYVSFTLSLFYISASLCSVIVSLHYDNLSTLYQFVISLRGFVVLLCQCCISLCRFLYVVMWTNPSIISVTPTPVINCICRYQSEKAGTVIRNKILNVDST